MGKIYRIEEISGLFLNKMDRLNTLIVIPVGILEYHAHHLPYGTDLYENEAVTMGMIKDVLSKNSYIDIILYPNIPLGVFGIENLSPSKFPNIGSFVISSGTMVNVLVELIGQFAKFGFKRAVIVSFHGAPDHCTAMNRAADEIHRLFPDFNALPVMSYLWFQLFFGGQFIPELEKKAKRKFTEDERQAVLHFVHAEAVETSAMLYLKPELVDEIYKDLEPVVYEYDEMFGKIGSLDRWDGYVGIPSVSKRDIGRAVIEVITEKCAELTSKFLKNEDLSNLKRYPEGLVTSN